MRKTKLYLDTSVPSFLFADDSPDRKEITSRFWTLLTIGIFDVAISEVLLVEVARAPLPLRVQLEERVMEINPEIVLLNDGMKKLAQKYVDETIIPVKYTDDALHLACATYSNCDAVVSWNFKHLVKLSTIRGVNGINKMFGLREIEILTPQSWIQEE